MRGMDSGVIRNVLGPWEAEEGHRVVIDLACELLHEGDSRVDLAVQLDGSHQLRRFSWAQTTHKVEEGVGMSVLDCKHKVNSDCIHHIDKDVLEDAHDLVSREEVLALIKDHGAVIVEDIANATELDQGILEEPSLSNGGSVCERVPVEGPLVS